MANTKQIKITKLFRKGAPEPNDCDEIQEENQQLEQKLKEKQNKLFQLQRNSYRRKCSPLKKKAENYIRPEKIVLSNSIESLKGNIELMSMLSGMEVQSYVANDHCCIVYHMQHDTKHLLKHGLRIDMKSGTNEVSKSSMPLGFNLSAVLEDFDNVMSPNCLGAIRKALVAYYDRLEQYQSLMKLFNLELQLFKVSDGSHIQVSFLARNDVEEDDQINVVLMLDYRVYDIRPKAFSIKEIDLPEGAAEALNEQCVIFKRKPLYEAFKYAFVDGVGTYKLSRQLGPNSPEQQGRPRRHRRTQPQNYNDDTFRPDDCSDSSDNDDDDVDN